MSLNFASVAISPSPVQAGAKFRLSVDVYDGDFEFNETLQYDAHQGFGDEARTIGGVLIALPAGYDDDFAFGDTLKADPYQGFGNEAQTIGGKLVPLPRDS